MGNRKTNIHSAVFEEGTSERDNATWRALDLSGEHLGVRVRELSPDCTSSYHHYHTTEEEHVLVLEGTATLLLGSEKIKLTEGDHIWFPAGEEVPHNIKNTSPDPFKYLVFGERKVGDLVFYPKGSVMSLRSADGRKQYSYEPHS